MSLINNKTEKQKEMNSITNFEKNTLIKKILQDLPKQNIDKIKNNLLFFQNFKDSKYFLNVNNNEFIEYLKTEPIPSIKPNLNNNDNDISLSTNTNSTVLNDLKENISELTFPSSDKKIFVKKHIDELKTFFSPQKSIKPKNIILSKTEHKKNKQIINQEVNLEDLLLLEEKFNDIKLTIINHCNNNNNIISLKCLEWWDYCLNSSINGNLEQYFIEQKFKELIHFFSIIQFACVFIIYDSSFNNKIIERNKNKIITLINLLQVNYLIIFDFIISKISSSCKNNLWVEKCLNMLKKKLIINISSHFTQIKLNNLNSYNILNDILLIIHVSPSKDEKKSQSIYEKFYDRGNEQLNSISKEEIIKLFYDNIYRCNNPKSSQILIQNNQNIIFKKPLKSHISLKQLKNYTFQLSFYQKNKSNCSIIQNNNLTSLNQSLENSTESKNNISYNNNNINNMNNINNNIYHHKISHPKISLQTYQNVLNLNKNNNKSNISFYNDILNKSPNYPLLKFPPTKELTLVLDLDETIISFHYTNENKKEGLLNLRPGLRIFLDEISQYYEIIIFTCATKEYASPILDKIEKDKKYFSGRLYREDNVIINNEYIKDISLLGRDIEKVIIVDNMIQNFRLQKENGILIKWYCGDDECDNTLFNLKKLLFRIYEEREEDVRNLLKKYKNEIIRKISSNMENSYNNQFRNTL